MTSVRRFLVSPSPHLWRGPSVSRVMYLVVLALMLPAGAAIFFFGHHALSVLGVSVGTAVLTEFVCKKMRGQVLAMDGSAPVTGILLGLILPPTVPLWMVAVGSVFAIAVVRELFGGLGHNVFNPALAARAFMSVSFSLPMTTWIGPTGFGADAITTATPLSGISAWQQFDTTAYRAMFLGNTAGSLGETSALAILIGGVLLLVLGIMSWRIPVTYIGTVVIMALAFGQDPLFHVLAGGLMIGALFMATDYVTSPLTNRGKVIFGVSLGVLTMLIRHFGGMPEGVCYAILFMNAMTPLIDRYTKERPYGFVERAKSAG
jgi:Na+-translocating ferredoxin:NAD+ oxidoreductase subunit D